MRANEISRADALAREIGLPDAVRDGLADALLDPDVQSLRDTTCAALTVPSTAADAWLAMKSALKGKDPDGIKLLALYVSAACVARDRYRAMGISDAIFTDTMKCFSRFLQEEKINTGRYVFTRGIWAWRHLSCQLFRLGTLEFEYRRTTDAERLPANLAPGTPVLFVHIPSDAKLTSEALGASYRQARDFFAEGSGLCPHGAPRAVLCHTWLLSRPLRALLPHDSGILRFGDDYDIYADDPEDESFYRWLFAGKRPPEPLPQGTSLQRIVSAHLEQGGKIGSGCGIMTA